MTEFMNIVNMLRMNGEEFVDHRVAEKILRTFLKKSDAVVISIEEYKDLTQLSVHEMLGSLLSHESIMNRYDDSWKMHSYLRFLSRKAEEDQGQEART